MSVSKVSFSGIYNINFPKNAKNEDVNVAYKKVNDYLQERPFLENTVSIVKFDKFVEKTAIKGFRIITTIDNPFLLVDLFSQISTDLGQQYIDKTKINLTV